MGRHVVVVGSGWAGLSAVRAAADGGARVSWVRGRVGASALGSGAYDGDGRIEASTLEALGRLGGDAVEVGACSVVGATGALRLVVARDAPILGLERLDVAIVVPRIAVGSWDADAVAARLHESIASHGGTARAIDASLLHDVREMRLAVADLAKVHDDAERAAWLIERLRESLARDDGQASAVVLPPVLGVDPATVATIRAAFPGVSVGEALGEPGGPLALRWMRLRDRVTRALGDALRLVDDALVSIDAAGTTLHTRGGESIAADAVVLATGGLVSGGIVYGGGEHRAATEIPSQAAPTFQLPIKIAADSIGAEVVAWVDGAPIATPSSLFGRDAEPLLDGRMPALLRVGLRVDRDGRICDRFDRATRPLYAAGDLIADAPRTVLTAIETGSRAGTAAASVP